MSVGWVGASVRARLLLRRRLGPERARALATSRTLPDALRVLSQTAWGRDVHPGLALGVAQRAVAAALLLHLRLLAGWLPPGHAEFLRSLTAWFELANVEDRLAYLSGGPLQRPFELGGLGAARARAAGAQTPAELRSALAASAWGDPGGESREAIHLGLRLGWARRVLADAPEATEWVMGALALLVARELYVVGRPLELVVTRPLPGLGSAWEHARTLAELADELPPRAAWALAGVAAADELWRAEAGWWTRLERDAAAMARRSREGRPMIVGAAVLLAADARRAVAALEVAARGGTGEALEVFDATA